MSLVEREIPVDDIEIPELSAKEKHNVTKVFSFVLFYLLAVQLYIDLNLSFRLKIFLA